MTFKSFIKIYGPPLLKAIRELEKIAIDMPEVCIMDTIILSGVPESPVEFTDPSFIYDYFSNQSFGSGVGLEPGQITISVERCNTIISKSGEKLGEYDFYFEWFTEPTMNQMHHLIEKIDEALLPLGCKYTITSKK